MEEEDTGFRFRKSQNKGWSFWTLRDKFGPNRSQQRAQQQRPFFHMVLCRWGNCSCAGEEWRNSFLVSMRPCCVNSTLNLPNHITSEIWYITWRFYFSKKRILSCWLVMIDESRVVYSRITQMFDVCELTDVHYAESLYRQGMSPKPWSAPYLRRIQFS